MLLICGSARNDGTCPGEISKSFRMVQWAQETLQQAQIDTDVLDLSLITSSYRLNIHPCKGCASAAMPLCHWPCSCYPNHSQGQTSDWMAEIYERWTAAHAVIIVTPVYWYQSPSPLKLMIDRLVCADGGILIRPPPTANGRQKPKRWNSKAGTTPNTWLVVFMVWWCMAMWQALRACGAACQTGWTGWA